MDSRSALTVSIGVLGGLAVAFTADVVTVPI
jgi:phage shock protein PspC (stress-responsive transcriptional regulator)